MKTLEERRAYDAAKSRKWRAANPDRARELGRKSARKWYAANPEVRLEQNRKWRLANPGHRRLEMYGITVADFDQILTAQDGRCACCLKVSGRTLHVDHDHKTGKPRGLLCSNCNTGLGLFGDDPILLRMALEYLAKHTEE